ncbi:MAG: phytanoyl-CoA dioxygenase family protein [Verrucomicrobia bacterium]|nr:phytanoyl-CoA dioxygenase family protein [Verrucomicrobiota bacterium]
MASIEVNNDHMARDLSFSPVHNPHPKRLTQAQIAHYNTQGYICPLRVYDAAGAAANRAYFDDLMARMSAMGDGRDQYAVNGYHTRCRGIYDLVMHPPILDCVEDLIGPDIVAWGTHFFCKLPHDPKKVPWHQDASYWPFDKSRTVTVWLAIDDADEGNAAMQFIPGTHAKGHLRWRETKDPAVLNQEIVDVEQFGQPVFDTLKAGEMSLHADMLAHGSEPNRSARRRGGLTIRYCPPVVRSLADWNRNVIICRGKDPSGHWQHHPRPAGEDLTLHHGTRKGDA